jgi:hypothetical protein
MISLDSIVNCMNKKLKRYSSHPNLQLLTIRKIIYNKCNDCLSADLRFVVGGVVATNRAEPEVWAQGTTATHRSFASFNHCSMATIDFFPTQYAERQEEDSNANANPANQYIKGSMGTIGSVGTSLVVCTLVMIVVIFAAGFQSTGFEDEPPLWEGKNTCTVFFLRALLQNWVWTLASLKKKRLQRCCQTDT